jgi:hypothetical protein
MPPKRKASEASEASEAQPADKCAAPEVPGPPNWSPIEVLCVKRACEEVGRLPQQKGGTLKDKTAECYAQHLRMTGKDGASVPWEDVPWTRKGHKEVFTLEDSIVARSGTNLWKKGVLIDREIKKTYHEIFHNEFLTEEGDFPSGKPDVEDAITFVKEHYWRQLEEARVERKKAKAALAAPAALANNEANTGTGDQTGQSDGVLALAGPVAESQEEAGSGAGSGGGLSGGLYQRMGFNTLVSAATQAASLVMASMAGDDEEEEEDDLTVRPMPLSFDGGIHFLTWSTLGPLGEKYPCYANAGSYDLKPAVPRSQIRSAALHTGRKDGKDGKDIQEDPQATLGSPTFVLTRESITHRDNTLSQIEYSNRMKYELLSQHRFTNECQRLRDLIALTPDSDITEKEKFKSQLRDLLLQSTATQVPLPPPPSLRTPSNPSNRGSSSCTSSAASNSALLL